MKYKIALHHSDEGYSVSMPGLPGCWSQGKAEALANIEAAIREYLCVVEDLSEDASSCDASSCDDVANSGGQACTAIVRA